MTPLAFLELLWLAKPEHLFILIWTLQNRRSQWYRDVTEAAGFVQQMPNTDLYVGVGLSRQDHGREHRCPSNEIAGIAGLWADLDLRSDAHSKTNLPGSIEQALSILPSEIPPSLVVSTGNGVHIWWLFREPWIFEKDDERAEAAALANRWHTLLRDNASQRGWNYERLADLARVLRIPGTTNCKDSSNPKAVMIRAQSDHRYNPSELTEYLDDLAVPDVETETRAAREWAERFQGKPLAINLSSRIPEDRLNKWLEADLNFRNTWFRQRGDLRDQSQSGYDLALACFGFGAGCSEQDVVDLIVHHRSLHKQKQRTRLDYFQRTVSKAFSRPADYGRLPLTPGTAAPPHVSVFPAMPAAATEHQGAGPPSAARHDDGRSKITLCRHISLMLGIEVLRLVKLTGKEPLYRMELAEGKIEFQNVGKFISQESVRLAIAATVGKLMPRIKAKEWEQLAQMLLSACIDEQGSEELQYEGAARMHIGQYLAESAFIPSVEGQVPQNLRKPMVHDGRITVCASDLQMYINKTTLQNLSVRTTAAMLSAIGATIIRVRGQNIKEQSRWELPLDEFTPSDYLTAGEESRDDQHE